jgi:trimeric autotransporter adhesin
VNRFNTKSKVVAVRQTGFVAQEVDALVKKSKYVFHGVDGPKNDNDPYTIRYAEFVVPLVKAVQELSVMNEERQKRIEQQQEQIDQLLKQLGKSGISNALEFSLLQNDPSPSTSNTEIKMVLPATVISATIIVYNLEGKQLKELKVGQRGDATVTIPGNELPAGMYIYTLIADGKIIDTKRVILTK